jgi:hypothetical protein
VVSAESEALLENRQLFMLLKKCQAKSLNLLSKLLDSILS